MAGAGYRTFQSGEVLTSTNVQTYLMDQAVQVYAGTAERGSAVPTPSAGMVAYSTATGLQVYNGSAWVDVGGGYGAATGGQSTATATISGVDYTILTFNSTGTLTNTKAGFFDYLLIGGGTGALNYTTGGGVATSGCGAGQVVFGSIYLDANQTITIGAGSSPLVYSASVNVFNEASPTTIAATSPFTQTALNGFWGMNIGGGSLAYVGGGGGCFSTGTSAALTESLAHGYRGGNSVNTTSAGGGGGQSARGGNGSGTTGGAGGNGVDISSFIGGSASYRATGGGGGGTVTGGAGGNSSASSNAGVTGTAFNSASANSGSGGGGGVSILVSGGNGGSGVCFIRWKV